MFFQDLDSILGINIFVRLLIVEFLFVLFRTKCPLYIYIILTLYSTEVIEQTTFFGSFFFLLFHFILLFLVISRLRVVIKL